MAISRVKFPEAVVCQERSQHPESKAKKKKGWSETPVLGHIIWVTTLFKNWAHKFPLLFKAAELKVLLFAAESILTDISGE